MKKAIKNYLAQLQENEEKGFSLVELIIVMAIMAILVGVVASQVIPYMEKSRQSKDQQQLSEVATAMVSAISESPVTVGDIPATALASLNDTAGGTAASPTNISTNLTELLKTDSETTLTDVNSRIKSKFKSKLFDGQDVSVSYNSSNGKTTVYVGATPDTAKKSTVESD